MEKTSKRILAMALALCMCLCLLPASVFAADLYVAETTVQQTVVIEQNFDDPDAFPVTTTDNSGAWLGTAGTAAGRWGIFYSDSTSVVNDFSYSDSQSIKVTRGGTMNTFEVNLTDAEAEKLANADYELSFMLYFMGQDKAFSFNSHNSGSEAFFLIDCEGLVKMKGADNAYVNGVTIPLKQWVRMILNVDRSTGTFRVSYAVDGKVYASEACATVNPDGISDRMSFSGALSANVTEGIAAYVDDVKLTVLTQAEVLGIEYTGDIIDQNFDDTEVFPTGLATLAGTTGTIVGRWGGFDGASTIVDSTSYSAGQSVCVNRPGGVNVNLLNDLDELSASDYEVSYMLYFNGVDKELCFESNGNSDGIDEVLYYIAKTGEIYVNNAGTNVKNGLTVPLGQWVKIVTYVDRAAGTFSVSYVTDVGTAKEKVHTSNTVAALNTEGTCQLPKLSAANLTGGITTGAAFYFDDVKVRTAQKYHKVQYKDYLKQDFDDTELFVIDGTASGIGTTGTLAGRWTGAAINSVNNQRFYGEGVEGATGQSIALERGGKAAMTVNLDTVITKETDFKASFKVYRPDTMSFVFNMKEMAFHATNTGAFKITNNTVSAYNVTTDLKFPADEWVTVEITSNRLAGNYTISLTGEKSGFVGKATNVLYTDGSATAMEFNAQASSNSSLATPYNAAYIDDVNVQLSATYITLEEALAAAKSGDTVKLTSDVSVQQAVVGAGVTLDLSGHTLSAGSLASFGSVIDSGNAKGALKAGDILLMKDNAQLPLYDEAVGGYRFFTYGIKTMEARADDGAVVFGFAVEFENSDAYGLLAGMDAQVSLAWDGMDGDAKVFGFSDTLIEKYAGLVLKYPSLMAVMMLSVNGTESLADGTALQVTPSIMTDAGVGITAESIVYSVAAAQ